MGVRAAFEVIFAYYGLPAYVRSDNGVPFGSTGAGGLSRLSVWFLKLGIEPVHIKPASPQQNGRHERMHRTMKAQTSTPAGRNQGRTAGALRRFTPPLQSRTSARGAWPDAAIGPLAVLARARALPLRIEDPWYDANHETRQLTSKGCLKWRGQIIFIGEALAGEAVGIAPIDGEGRSIVRFCSRDLGVIDATFAFHRFAPPRPQLHRAVEGEGDSRTNAE